jgi:hypothetical protein
MTAAPPTHISWIEGPILLKYIKLINVTKRRDYGGGAWSGRRDGENRDTLNRDTLHVPLTCSAKFFRGNWFPLLEKMKNALLIIFF